ncbi:MAG: ABC transporter ATP-binding protein [Acidimicrobiales bacterium]
MSPKGARSGDSGGASTAVSCSGLTKSYGEATALDGVDLRLGKGQTVVLIGPNGSGKTTLLRIVAGLLEPSQGEVRVLGAKAGSIEARSVTAYIPDNPVLYDDLSVEEHLEYVARLHGASEWGDRADDLVGRLGLADRSEQLPSRFSRGLRQKTAIAVALVRPSSVLLVDEPFVGLDRPGRDALLDLLDEVAAQGVTVVVATHQADYLERARRCVGMRDGRVAYDGPATAKAVGELLG